MPKNWHLFYSIFYEQNIYLLTKGENMFSEIYDLLGIDSIGTEMCVTFVMNKGAVVQGYKKVVSISDTNIIVIGKNKRKIELVGKYL